jgi:hypothetical protein
MRIRNPGFDDEKFKKIYCRKKNLDQTTIYLSLGLGFPSYGRNLRLYKKNVQHFKT